VTAPRTALALAALACAAIPGLEPVATRAVTSTGEDVDVAEVTDVLGRQWVVRAPRTATAGARLEAEAGLLASLAGYLPFAVPTLEGSAPLPEGGRAVVSRALPGRAMTAGDVADLAASPRLAQSLGRCLAAIHDLPERHLESAGSAAYDAEEHRGRRLTELDRAAATGFVPPRLLTRWENALEEAGAWRFVPCVVHGDLDAGHVLLDGDTVSGVVEWGQVRIADPADDLAWLAASVEPATFESVLVAYSQARRTTPDRDLARRAGLAGELALARWLLHGTSNGDRAVTDDAIGMLTDLDAAVAETPW